MSEEIRRFNELVSPDVFELLFNTSPKALRQRTGRLDLPSEKVGMLYSLAYRWINVKKLCQSLIVYLAGKPFEAAELMPFSPIVGFEEQRQAENPSLDEIRRWLGV